MNPEWNKDVKRLFNTKVVSIAKLGIIVAVRMFGA